MDIGSSRSIMLIDVISMLPEIDKSDKPVEGELLPISNGGFLDIAFDNNGTLNAAVSFIDGLNSLRSKSTARTVLNTIARLFGSPGHKDFEWHRLELKHIKFVMKILGSSEEDLLKDVGISRTYYLRALHVANCKLWKTGYVSTRTDWSTLSPITERKIWKRKSKNTRKLYISILKGVSREAHTMDLMPTNIYLKIKDYRFRSAADGVQYTTLDGEDARCGRKIKCHPNYRTLQRSNSCKNPFKTMAYFNSAICKRFVGMEAGIIKVSS